MKSWAMLLILAIAFITTGCAERTPTEQLSHDIKKAGNQIEKDLKSF